MQKRDGDGAWLFAYLVCGCVLLSLFGRFTMYRWQGYAISAYVVVSVVILLIRRRGRQRR
jgi:hypothetical protein